MTSFALGQLYITKNALSTLKAIDMTTALSRFSRGDWGDVDKEDWEANEQALKHGGRLMGVYRDRNGTKFWIITEADRSTTTILLPEDY